MICRGREINLDNVKKDLEKCKEFIKCCNWFTVKMAHRDAYGDSFDMQLRIETEATGIMPCKARVYCDYEMSEDTYYLLKQEITLGGYKRKDEKVCIELSNNNSLELSLEGM